ncbi:DUF983 domain-containing protein [Pedobacter mendelii]|uniref:DUF983 domain-containing protein n=1 Tax=Pedobacter mendelii TaxID=1908240 RepID=A0ABQ2BEE6_9SPHI|nr:DUF983 domain-containing protein [Pedobacter mendelii]GGI22455.1 hypothetical protein GCM10008119_02730 [Pedobacter mendelii]
MAEKTSKLYAIVHAKCPHCRRGDVFTGSMYGFNIQHTKEVCSRCGQRIEIEPGYFYAAMYVSYAMNVVEMLIVSFIIYLLVGPLEDNTFWTYLIVIFAGCFILSPFNYRYSRIILLHILSPNIKYKPYYDNP